MLTASAKKQYLTTGIINSRELAAYVRIATFCQRRLEALAAKLAEFEGRTVPLSQDFEKLRQDVLELRDRCAFLACSVLDDRAEMQRQQAT